jgi:6-phosphogluconolactonase (cycloisomerase 2 family)
MFALVGCTATEDKGSTLLIGTYTDAVSRGIYRTTFSDEGFSMPELVVEVDNPSFLALSDDGDYLYAVSEGGTDATSALNAYRYDATTDSFSLINRQPTHGASPCYVRLFDGYAYTANYTGGSLTRFAIMADGSLGEAVEQEYEPKQGSPSHIHGIFPAPDGESIFVTDLGRSEIFRIVAPDSEIFRTELTTDAGPRHMASRRMV